jgi:hypothetical protein
MTQTSTQDLLGKKLCRGFPQQESWSHQPLTDLEFMQGSGLEGKLCWVGKFFRSGVNN